MYDPPTVNERDDSALSVNIAQRVRGNVANAGIAAALLIYFGFFGMPMFVTETVADHAYNAYVRVIQVGGIVSLIAAFLCSTGRLFALAFDGVTALLIGIAMAICVLVMWSEYPVFLYGLFAAMFIMAGYRDTQAWLGLSRIRQALSPSPDGGTMVQGGQMSRTSDYVSMPVIDRTPRPVAAPEESGSAFASEMTPSPPGEPVDDGPAPDGFLASFAPESDDDEKND